jgi:hypothetical protein
MWISLFTVVLALALGFGIGALMLESQGYGSRRYSRRRIRHYS